MIQQSARFRLAVAILAVLVSSAAFAALTVTAPPAGTSIIAAGNDYASQVLGDAWDMNDATDVETRYSVGFSSQSFTGGIYTGVESSTGCNAGFYPLFQGYGPDTVALARGQRFPINPATYRFLSMKIMATGGTAMQQNDVFFFQYGPQTGGPYGASVFKYMSPNQWTIQTWDMNSEVYVTAPYTAWSSMPYVQGLEVIPCNGGSATVKFDWIRLTAEPTTAQTYNVTWSDTGGSSTYTIMASDADGTTYPFTTTATGSSYAADFSRLAPGEYHVLIIRNADSTQATSTGVVHINTPPKFGITAPSIRGEQSFNYAQVELGVPWGPMNSANFKPTSPPNFKNISYTNPIGSFYGRPTSFDPEFIMNTTGHPVDANRYRSVCFTFEVFGPLSLATGSVARVLWGINSSSVTTTTDIVLDDGLMEYCIPDLSDAVAVPLVTGSPQPWAGSLGYFRLDPHEMTPPNGCTTPQTCHDVQLDSIILSPFAHANPGYTFQWILTDPDNASDTVDIYLDRDTTPLNGNEIHVGSTVVTSGNGQLVWNSASAGSINYGTWHVLMVADDGVNSVTQYAGGPLVTGAYDGIFRNGFDSQ